MSVGFLDLVRVTLSTTGTGSTLSIAAAVAGWLDFTTAGGVNGTTYRYAIIDGNNTEIGTAVYNSGSNALSARTVTKSTNGNAALNLTSAAILAVSVAAEDLVVGGTNYGTMAAQGAASVVITGGTISGLSSLSSSGNIASTNGGITTGGATGGFDFKDRTSALDWLWYADAGAAHLWNATHLDMLQAFVSGGICLGAPFFDPGAGNLITNGTLFASPPSGTTPGLYVNQTATGSFPGTGYNYLNQYAIAYNAASTVGSIFGDLSQVTVNGSSASASGGGGLFALGGIVTVQTQSATSGSTYTGVFGGAVGRTSPAGTGAGLWGFNANSIIEAGVTGFSYVVGLETDVQVALGGTVTSKWGQIVALGALDRVAGTVNDAAFSMISESASSPGWKYGYQVDAQFNGLSPIASNGTAFGTRGSMSIGIGLDLSSAACFTAEIKTAHMTLDGAGNMSVTGPTHTFGVTGNLKTQFNVTGPSSGSGQTGAYMSVVNGGSNIVLFGNYSAVWAHDHTGGTAYDPMGLIYTAGAGTIGSTIQPGKWLYISGQTYPGTFAFSSAGTNPDFPTGIAFGWNQSNFFGEANIVANTGGGAIWDFKFQDWNSTTNTLKDLLSVAQTGGFYTNSTKSLTALQASTFFSSTAGQAATGLTLGSTADTWAAMAMTWNDSTKRVVPYNASGTQLSAALNCGIFHGYYGNGAGVPLIQASTQVAHFVYGKANSFGSGGTSVYGQGGCLWLNAWGGWNGTCNISTGVIAFTQSVALTTSSKTLTVPVAPASNAYYEGQPLSGTGIPANTVVVVVNSTTSITINNFPTVNSTQTVTFTNGGPGVTPGDTFLWVGEAHTYDPNSAGCGAEVFEGVAATHNNPSVPSAVTYGCRVLCGLANAFNIGSNPVTHIIGMDVHSEFYNGLSTGGIAYNAAASNVSGITVTWGLFGATSLGGSITMSATVSDPKVKKDVARLPSTAALIKAIDVVSFKWADGYHGAYPGHQDNTNFGFLSYSGHDLTGVREALDDHGFAGTSICTTLGTKFHGDIVSVEARQMTAILWKGVQELWAETENLLDRMNGLEARVETIERGMAAH